MKSIVCAICRVTYLAEVRYTYIYFSKVRNTIKSRFGRWRDGRNLASTRYTRASVATEAGTAMNGRSSVGSIGKFNFLKNNNESQNGKPQHEEPMLTPALADEAV